MNMDYCKFENTYKDLMQCLEVGEPVDDIERKYAGKMFKAVLDTLINEGVIEGYDKEELEYFINAL